ncbi:hypothetical protein TWF281_003706 [Arthrobotrys megalospora]
MSSIINTSEYVLLDNAENATLTPLQRTPCLTPSECSQQSPVLIPVSNIPATSNASTQSTSILSSSPAVPPQSYESFARELSINRSNYYLESIVLAKCMGDEQAEKISSEKAKELLGQLYPGENADSIFFVRLARYLRKHSKVDWAVSALDEVATGSNGKELPGLVEKEDRISYWYYRALSNLELETGNNVEEAIKNGMVEAVGNSNEEQRKLWIHVGYFSMSVYFILKGDEVDARFWKNQLPTGWAPPAGIFSRHEELFNRLTTGHSASTANTPRPTDQIASRDISQLEGLTTQDILMRDVARMKRDINEVFDVVYVNYKEMSERIKSIHSILDGREKVDGGELEELKKRLDYLERMTLRG